MESKINTRVIAADDVTQEILDAAESVEEHFTGEPINWEDFLNRIERIELSDGSKIDMGESLDSPAIRKVKKHIRQIRREMGA